MRESRNGLRPVTVTYESDYGTIKNLEGYLQGYSTRKEYPVAIVENEDGYINYYDLYKIKFDDIDLSTN